MKSQEKKISDTKKRKLKVKIETKAISYKLLQRTKKRKQMNAIG